MPLSLFFSSLFHLFESSTSSSMSSQYLSCHLSRLPLFSPYSFLNFFPCILSLSLHFCCFFSLYQSSNFTFLTLSLFLPTPAPHPLPPIPCISCPCPGNFTDKSPASSLIISNARRLPPHPLHSNQLRSKPWKMSRWSSRGHRHAPSAAQPGLAICLWFVLCFCYKNTAYRNSLESTICV